MHSRVGEDAMVAAFDSYTMPRAGAPIELEIELDSIHLFDEATQSRL